MARKLKLDIKPGGPVTQIPASWYIEVTRAVNALYNLQGAGTIKIVMPDTPSEKAPIVVDGATSLRSPNVV
jgi:hypothetical protein